MKGYERKRTVASDVSAEGMPVTTWIITGNGPRVKRRRQEYSSIANSVKVKLEAGTTIAALVLINGRSSRVAGVSVIQIASLWNC